MPAIHAVPSWARAAVLGSALLLDSCGGSFSIGFGDGFDESPPSVSLATAVSSVQAGQPVRFIAAASDENGIDHVDFYRVGSNGAVLLGTDSGEPYEWTATAPTDGSTALSVFARATDNFGNQADSVTVIVVVTP